MPGISLADRSMFVRFFFLKRLTGAVVYTLILRRIPIIFHTYKKIYSVICSFKKARVKTFNTNIQTLAACSGWLLQDNKGILSGLS